MQDNKDTLISAYVIHTRPFQDNKILLDLLTLESGLVRAVFRLPKKEARVIPGPFLRYQVLLKGRTELKTVYVLESSEPASNLEGLRLFAGMYVHEILLKLLPTNLPLSVFFELYQWLILSLHSNAPVAPLLRRFEHALFEEIGSSINLAMTATGNVLDPNAMYRFDVRFGLRPYYGDKPKQLPDLFISGQMALDYSEGLWGKADVVRLAKTLHRIWLDHLLEGKEVVARRLLPDYQFHGERHYTVPVFRSDKTQ
ncbi:DNA recombination protein RecO [Marinomonas sp. SBI22]|uniref:DNA repair protein RecO n=1 Tax=unclassified Marinomonas TaxID=196814 RepID=UPI0007AEFEF7|nr:MULTISPECIES: recombination protein O N-terminal domain-containing protein [unclassified Marinomonas]KZM40784.1 DNA recombination protein RecO [Marinomonas sp. SBI8L]KZM46031.1 DNA recombination protein RecO [Marinomonas sp. SBI22]